MRLVKTLACWLFVLTGLTRLARRANRHRGLVVTYHGVHAGPADGVLNFDGMHVRARRFARQMRHLARHYRVVSLDTLLVTAPSGRPLAAITFDDGYLNVYHNAFPILKALGLPAMLFVPTDFLVSRRGVWWDRLRVMVGASDRRLLAVTLDGRNAVLPIRTAAERAQALVALNREARRRPPAARDALLAALAAQLDVPGEDAGRLGEPLTLAELREMVAHGFEIGSHGTAHDSFLHLTADELAEELDASRRALEALTGRPVHWLAYPHGDVSEAVARAVERAGYRGAVTAVETLTHAGIDAYQLPRIVMHDGMDYAEFVVAVSGLRELVKNGLAAVRRRSQAAWPDAVTTTTRADIGRS